MIFSSSPFCRLQAANKKRLNSFHAGARPSLRHKAIDAGGDGGIDWQYRYLRPQLLRLPAGINNRQLFQLEIRERNTHRGCERRRIHPLDLYAETAAALEQQQIVERRLMRSLVKLLCSQAMADSVSPTVAAAIDAGAAPMPCGSRFPSLTAIMA